MGWRDGSVVKRTGCSSRGPKVQYPYGSSQLSATPVPGALMSFSGLRGDCRHLVHSVHGDKTHSKNLKKKPTPLPALRHQLWRWTTESQTCIHHLYHFSPSSRLTSDKPHSFKLGPNREVPRARRNPVDQE